MLMLGSMWVRVGSGVALCNPLHPVGAGWFGCQDPAYPAADGDLRIALVPLSQSNITVLKTTVEDYDPKRPIPVTVGMLATLPWS